MLLFHALERKPLNGIQSEEGTQFYLQLLILPFSKQLLSSILFLIDTFLNLTQIHFIELAEKKH